MSHRFIKIRSAMPAIMYMNPWPIVLILAFFECEISAAELKNFDAFQAAAAKANLVLSIPNWEQTPDALNASIMKAIAKGNAALDKIGLQNLEYVTFKSSVAALENLRADESIVANHATTISETNPDPVMRSVAENALKRFQEWNIGIDYREDVFKAIKAFAAKQPNLTGEDEKLLSETLRDFRRAGMELPAEKRKEISNPIFERIFLPIDPQTSFISSFRGFNGYDAGYYSYAWADAIAADMAMMFEKSKNGFLDKETGMNLRREIYAPGDSRDVTLSITRFLGRKQSIQPFLKKLQVRAR